MDVSSIANLGTALSQTATGQAVGILVLKKAIEIESQGALQLLEAATSSNPAHLGQSVDIRA